MADDLSRGGKLGELERRVAALQAQIDDLQVEVRQTRAEIIALRPSVDGESVQADTGSALSQVPVVEMPPVEAARIVETGTSSLSELAAIPPVIEEAKPAAAETPATVAAKVPAAGEEPSAPWPLPPATVKEAHVDRAEVRKAAVARLVRPADPSVAPPTVAAAPPHVPSAGPTIAASSGPRPSERKVNWEAVIGGNWLNRIGVVVLLLAGAFLAHLAWQRHWVNPTLQTAMVFLAGAVLLIGGEVYQRRGVKIFAQGLTSLGIFALYAGGFVGYHLHHLLSMNATFAVYSVITAISFLLAARTNSVAVVLLGMLGGYLTPVILSTGQNAAVELFTYLLFLNAAIAATSIAKRWDFLQLIAFIATAAMFIGWGFKFYDDSQRRLTETLLAVHAGLFIVAGLFPHLVLGRETSAFSRWVLTKASMTFFGVTYLLFRSVKGHHLGEFAAAYALGHWLVAGGIYALRGGKDRLIGYLLGLGAIYITLAIPIYYSAHQLAVAWAIEALVFTVIGVWYRNIRTLATAVGAFGLAVVWTVSHELINAAARGDWWFIDARFGTVGIVAAALAGAALAYRFGRPRLVGLYGTDSPIVPFVFMIAGDVLLAAGAMHQFLGNQLELAWTANAVIAAGLARWRRHESVGWFALIALVPAVWRFLGYEFGVARAAEWRWEIDLRFARGLAVVAGVWATATLVRLRLKWEDWPERSTVTLVLGDVLLLIVAWFQWHGQTLMAIYALNALGMAVFGRWQALPKFAWSSAVAFGWAVVWWMGNLNGAPPDTDVLSSFAHAHGIAYGFIPGLVLAAAGWLAAVLVYGRQPRGLASVLGLGMDVVLMGTLRLQWHEPIFTGIMAANALGLAMFAFWKGMPWLAWVSLAAFAFTTEWWLATDVVGHKALVRWPAVKAAFASGLALVAAGWIAAALFRKREPRFLANILALGVNLVLLGAIALQWSGYLVLLLWTIDVAALWAIGFKFDYWSARLEAFVLWIGLLCGWILFEGLNWSYSLSEFALLTNPRFISLSLVALVGFGAGWAYRTRLSRLIASGRPTATIGDLFNTSLGQFIQTASGASMKERHADWICAVLANGVLVLALTMEIVTRFAKYQYEGNSPFANWEMARQAAMSMLWTSYAAVAFIGAFVLRYRPVRLLALISLGPILVKVFLVDLRDLDVIYRVLSFAVLGVVFLGISYLYQRYARRITPE